MKLRIKKAATAWVISFCVALAVILLVTSTGCDLAPERKTVSLRTRYLTEAAFAVARAQSSGNQNTADEECKTCKGTGKWTLDGKPQGKCPACNGTGKQKKRKSFRAGGGEASSPLVKPPLVLLPAIEGGDESTKPDKEPLQQAVGSENTGAAACCERFFEELPDLRGQIIAMRESIEEIASLDSQNHSIIKKQIRMFLQRVQGLEGDRDAADEEPETEKLLLVFGILENCEPCSRAKDHMQKNKRLSAILTKHFSIKEKTMADGERPTFTVGHNTLTGYPGPDALLAWLKTQVQLSR